MIIRIIHNEHNTDINNDDDNDDMIIIGGARPPLRVPRDLRARHDAGAGLLKY